MSSKQVEGRSTIFIFGQPVDKKKVPARIVIAVTVLFLIISGLPVSDVYDNVASADSNPYAPVGTIVVNANNDEAAFSLSGPNATYIFGSVGSGLTWSNTNAEIGTYTITYSPITGYYTPARTSQTLVNSGDTITFTGTYNPLVGTISVTTNNAASTFTISGPVTYTGSGLTWSQTNAPVGTYTITYDPLPGYETPSNQILTLGSGETITFDGTYIPSTGTITVTTNNAAATFTITGPATYTGSGTTWSQSNAPAGTYTITYDPIAGYSTPTGSSQTIVNSGDIIAFTGTYEPLGTITVNTNNAAATFTVTGPATYSGSGLTWSQTNAPAGTYTITYDPVSGYSTPAGSSQTIVNSEDTIAFTGTYEPLGTITVSTNNAAATFTITGPATYSGSGTTWSQTNAPAGTYTITYDPVAGYNAPAGSSLTIVNSGDTIAFTGTYDPLGTITVTTNNAAATFTITGPATYSGSGTWSQANAPAGTYTITYDPVTGYSAPAGSTQTIVNSGDIIAFTGTYNPDAGAISVTTNNAAATFTVTGPATYSGSGLTWSQTNAPVGTYTITYDSVTGYSTPAGSFQTIVNNGDTITFTGTYTAMTVMTVTLNASADTYIDQNSASNNFGTLGYMYVQSRSNRNMRSLIRFNTSGIPAGSSIISATLNVYAYVPASSRTYNVYNATTSWVESGAGGVTWNTQPSVVATATSSANTPSTANWMVWTVTPDVQAWVNGNNNNGWLIRDQNEVSSTTIRTSFRTREASTYATQRPKLVIQYWG